MPIDTNFALALSPPIEDIVKSAEALQTKAMDEVLPHDIARKTASHPAYFFQRMGWDNALSIHSCTAHSWPKLKLDAGAKRAPSPAKKNQLNGKNGLGNET